MNGAGDQHAKQTKQEGSLDIGMRSAAAISKSVVQSGPFIRITIVRLIKF